MAQANVKRVLSHFHIGIEDEMEVAVGTGQGLVVSGAVADIGARAQDCPGIEEAVRGMQFIELAVATSASDTKWHDVPEL